MWAFNVLPLSQTQTLSLTLFLFIPTYLFLYSSHCFHTVSFTLSPRSILCLERVHSVKERQLKDFSQEELKIHLSKFLLRV